MIKYGIKIWSINKEWFPQAVELIKQGRVDFVELYIVPHSFKREDLEVLKQVPVTIHAPHWQHNFNVFELNNAKIELFKEEVIGAADFLKSRHIVVHAGVGESKEVFKENISKIHDKRILIENMPKMAIDGRTCFGYSLEQLKFIKEVSGLDFCFDFAHASKSALSQNLHYQKFIKSLLTELKPYYFHICGATLDNEEDEHLNLFEGDLDIIWVKKTLTDLAKSKDIYLVFEVPKGKDLENDIKNINYFKNL